MPRFARSSARCGPTPLIIWTLVCRPSGIKGVIAEKHWEVQKLGDGLLRLRRFVFDRVSSKTGNGKRDRRNQRRLSHRKNGPWTRPIDVMATASYCLS